MKSSNVYELEYHRDLHIYCRSEDEVLRQEVKNNQKRSNSGTIDLRMLGDEKNEENGRSNGNAYCNHCHAKDEDTRGSIWSEDDGRKSQLQLLSKKKSRGSYQRPSETEQFRKIAQERMVSDTPSTLTSNAYYGTVECKYNCASGAPLCNNCGESVSVTSGMTESINSSAQFPKDDLVTSLGAGKLSKQQRNQVSTHSLDDLAVARAKEDRERYRVFHSSENVNPNENLAEIACRPNQNEIFASTPTMKKGVVSAKKQKISKGKKRKKCEQTLMEQAMTAISETRSGKFVSSNGGNQDCKGKVTISPLPNRPKRPMSAYNFFFREERMRLSTEQENSKEQRKIKFVEFGKKIGHNWRHIDAQDSARYEAAAQEEHERYKREMDEFHDEENKRRRTFLFPEGQDCPCPLVNIDTGTERSPESPLRLLAARDHQSLQPEEQVFLISNARAQTAERNQAPHQASQTLLKAVSPETPVGKGNGLSNLPTILGILSGHQSQQHKKLQVHQQVERQHFQPQPQQQVPLQQQQQANEPTQQPVQNNIAAWFLALQKMNAVGAATPINQPQQSFVPFPMLPLGNNEMRHFGEDNKKPLNQYPNLSYQQCQQGPQIGLNSQYTSGMVNQGSLPTADLNNAYRSQLIAMAQGNSLLHGVSAHTLPPLKQLSQDDVSLGLVRAMLMLLQK